MPATAKERLHPCFWGDFYSKAAPLGPLVSPSPALGLAQALSPLMLPGQGTQRAAVATQEEGELGHGVSREVLHDWMPGQGEKKRGSEVPKDTLVKVTIQPEAGPSQEHPPQPVPAPVAWASVRQ